MRFGKMIMTTCALLAFNATISHAQPGLLGDMKKGMHDYNRVQQDRQNLYQHLNAGNTGAALGDALQLNFDQQKLQHDRYRIRQDLGYYPQPQGYYQQPQVQYVAQPQVYYQQPQVQYVTQPQVQYVAQP